MIKRIKFLVFLLAAHTAQFSQAQLAGQASLESIHLSHNANLASQADYRHAAIRVLLAPEKETVLSSSVAAKIIQLNVSLGSAFDKGQTLLKFSCKEQIARKNMVQAELAGALETHEGKVKMQGLKQASSIEVALAASEVARLRAQLTLSAVQIENCQIKAPWQGRVSKVFVSNHMSVAAGEPLLELVKDGRLKIRLNVPSKKLSHINVGDLFAVNIDETGSRYQAKIVAINSRIDSVSQTIELEGRMIEHYPGLLAGMSGTAILAEKQVE
ncbi:MAG: HlyD family efflux transporter periplasmic adaptor subunit [Porticoccaceae bacterium]